MPDGPQRLCAWQMGLAKPKARTYGKVEKDAAEKKPVKEKVAASV